MGSGTRLPSRSEKGRGGRDKRDGSFGGGESEMQGPREPRRPQRLLSPGPRQMAGFLLTECRCNVYQRTGFGGLPRQGVMLMQPEDVDRPHPTRAARRRLDQAHPHTGLLAVGRDEYRSWEIVVEHRKVGMTLQREQFSVTISDTTAPRSEHLSGFHSRLSAVQAAQRRVDFILDIQDPHQARPRSKTKRRNGRV